MKLINKDEDMQYIPYVNGTIRDIFVGKNKEKKIAEKVTARIAKTFIIETEICLVLILILLYLDSKENIEVVMARYVLLTKNEFNQGNGIFPNLALGMLSDYDKQLYLDLLVNFSEKIGSKDGLIEMWVDLIKWCKL